MTVLRLALLTFALQAETIEYVSVPKSAVEARLHAVTLKKLVCTMPGCRFQKYLA